jgi:Enoyl-(Acyl carrier protein) reductase
MPSSWIAPLESSWDYEDISHLYHCQRLTGVAKILAGPFPVQYCRFWLGPLRLTSQFQDGSREISQREQDKCRTISGAVSPMKRKRYGRVINISSVFSMSGFHTMSHYTAAKSALLGLTKSWAREWAPFGITVNAVAPGTVESTMTLQSLGKAGIERIAKEVPLGRIATPLEISLAVAWLASEEAAMMTGQVISPNGGQAIVGI